MNKTLLFILLNVHSFGILCGQSSQNIRGIVSVDKTVEFVPQISGQDVPVVSVEIVPLLLGN